MVSTAVDSVAGFASGTASIAVGQPFDTIKVRLQTQSPRPFRGTMHCLTDTLLIEGWRGLWRGHSPHPLWRARDSPCVGTLSPLLTASVINAVLYALLIIIILNSAPAGFLRSTGRCTESPGLLTNNPSPHSRHREHSLRCRLTLALAAVWRRGLCRCGAGVAYRYPVVADRVQCVVATPSELVKCKLQTQTGQYNGNLDCIRKVWAAEGPRGLYKGKQPLRFVLCILDHHG